MENPYLSEAWCNSPFHCVYGFHLRPFCLYYEHLLKSIGSLVMDPRKKFGPADLLMAAEVCSMPFSPEGYTLDLLYHRSFLNRLRRARNQARLLTCVFTWQASRWNTYASDYISAAEKWEDSGERYDEFGALVSSGKKGPRNDLEKIMATATFLISETGWSEKAVMTMPLGKVYAWVDYFAIQKGVKVAFKTAREQAAMDADRERRRKASAGVGGVVTPVN